MLNKSLIYKNAALRLLSEGMYSQAVSMFYFTALQKMMYAYAEKTTPRMAYEDQIKQEVDTHECVFNGVYQAINQNEKEKFKEIFWDLHKIRKVAEYDSQLISQDEAVEARSMSEHIEGYLNRSLGVPFN